MLKKPKKINLTKQRRKLIKECTSVWEGLVRAEYGNACVLCSKPANSIHHFHRKSMCGHIRFYVPNGVPVCMGCHLLKIETPLGIEALRKKRGEAWYQDIMDKARNAPLNFKASIKFYRGELEKLKTK